MLLIYSIAIVHRTSYENESNDRHTLYRNLHVSEIQHTFNLIAAINRSMVQRSRAHSYALYIINMRLHMHHIDLFTSMQLHAHVLSCIPLASDIRMDGSRHASIFQSFVWFSSLNCV